MKKPRATEKSAKVREKETLTFAVVSWEDDRCDTCDISYSAKGLLWSCALSSKSRQLQMNCVCEGTMFRKQLIEEDVSATKKR